MEIVDNGSPGAGRDTLQVEEDNIDFPEGDDPALDVPITLCPPSLAREGTPLYGGADSPFGSTVDYVVTDAHPMPTSKDQCKNGGWKNFPGFKNQGHCVSFVATGGKNQPKTG